MKSQEDKFNLVLQSVARTGRQWNVSIPVALLADDSFVDLDVDSALFGDMRWQGQLSAEAGSFMLKGAWQMDVPRQCGRCNVEFAQPMLGDVDVSYEIGSPESQDMKAELELTGDEPEVLENGELNVLDVLREHFWLAWQPLVVCSEDCKGLCLQCGANKNQKRCDCSGEKKENPFAALKNLKFDA